MGSLTRLKDSNKYNYGNALSTQTRDISCTCIAHHRSTHTYVTVARPAVSKHARMSTSPHDGAQNNLAHGSVRVFEAALRSDLGARHVLLR